MTLENSSIPKKVLEMHESIKNSSEIMTPLKPLTKDEINQVLPQIREINK